MTKTIQKYPLFFLLFCSPIFAQAAEDYHCRPHPIHSFRPVLTTGAIIEIYEEGNFQGIVLIQRGKSPFGKALPGGKIEYGETVEHAVRREMEEETHLILSELKQFHVYSDPSRDSRHHSVEVTFLAKAYSQPRAGDDAAEAFVYSLDAIPWDELTFDHKHILEDYLDYRQGNSNRTILLP